MATKHDVIKKVFRGVYVGCFVSAEKEPKTRLHDIDSGECVFQIADKDLINIGNASGGKFGVSNEVMVEYCGKGEMANGK